MFSILNKHLVGRKNLAHGVQISRRFGCFLAQISPPVSLAVLSR